MSEQAYPTREQAERLRTMDCDEIRCETCDASQWCWTGDGMMATKALSTAVLAMHDALDAKQAEIDRLRAMVPKTIRPEIASPEPCGSPVICKCGWIVAVMDDLGESIFDSDDHTRANFCGQCGAEMEYSEFDMNGLEEQHGTI